MIRATFHPLARRELKEAAQYYEQQSDGLGKAFLDQAERAVALLREHPEAGTAALGTARRYVVDRFPYSIIYTFRPGRLRIVSVMHHSRRPDYWTSRIS